LAQRMIAADASSRATFSMRSFVAVTGAREPAYQVAGRSNQVRFRFCPGYTDGRLGRAPRSPVKIHHLCAEDCALAPRRCLSGTRTR
jgi:hypothetical protein